MQALILLWADCSGKADSLREHAEDVGYLGWSILVKDISRHRPLTILDDGRVIERLAKA
jgi:hypothetical protein